jgi:hypothetical protein
MPPSKKKPAALNPTRQQREMFAQTMNPLVLLSPRKAGSKSTIAPLPIENVTEEYLGRPSTIRDGKRNRQKKSTNSRGLFRS